MKMKILIMALVIGFWIGFNHVMAAPITIEITGNVTSASGSALPSTIHAGVDFTGIYTYDSSTPDSVSLAFMGKYCHNSPYGVSISMGGYEFKTTASHTNLFTISIYNDISDGGIHDLYQISSFDNISIPSVGFTIASINWGLRDNTHSALSSDALPITAPVLTNWDYNLLWIYGLYNPDHSEVSVYGTVTQTVLIPEPLTGILMAMGIVFLRRK